MKRTEAKELALKIIEYTKTLDSELTDKQVKMLLGLSYRIFDTTLK